MAARFIVAIASAIIWFGAGPSHAQDPRSIESEVAPDSSVATGSLIITIDSSYVRPSAARSRRGISEPLPRHVVRSLDSIYVVVDGDFDDPLVLRRDTIDVPEDLGKIAYRPLVLPEGRREIVASFQTAHDVVFAITIVPDTVRVMRFMLVPAEDAVSYGANSSYPRLHHGRNLVVHTDPESEIFVDGESVGFGEAWLDVPSGSHRIRTVHPHHVERVQHVEVSDARLLAVEMHNRPDRRTTYLRSVLPGGTQLHRREKLKGTALALGTLAGVGIATWHESQFLREKDRFGEIRVSYWEAETELEATRLGREMDDQYEALQKVHRRRNLILIATAAVYAANLFDALKPPKYGFRDAGRLDARRVFAPFLSDSGAGFHFSMRL